MTAEIAILNKSAVALAADSAVTISHGTAQQKIFDTADKLFELSNKDAIGIMINNDMNFLETPLPVLIKKFRAQAPTFESVENASENFLLYLTGFIEQSSDKVRTRAFRASIQPLYVALQERFGKRWQRRVFDDDQPGLRQEYVDDPGLVSKAISDALDEELAVFRRLFEGLPDAEFIGGGEVEVGDVEEDCLELIAREHLDSATDPQIRESVEIGKLSLLKRGTMGPVTGVIIAGFGKDDLFPTLISYDLSGAVGGWLKVDKTNHVDIDRDGEKAKVIPFAQREMVERFLYGLDHSIQQQITSFCRSSVPVISEQMIDAIDLPDNERAGLSTIAENAQVAFFNGLDEHGFDAIRKKSREEIEDMVEFMPKPEMARMAEALINLTSIKRRVSRGFETVGGPIDVAVISQAEGFVWVRRKHYFPQELNGRYLRRMGAEGS